MMQRGEIHFEQAYAQGKMLQSASWHGILPRNITPSDVDLFFEAAGCVLFVEITRNNFPFQSLPKGQRLALRSFVSLNEQRVLVAVCRHDVPTDCQINTMEDILEFQVIGKLDGQFVGSDVYDGSWWQKFVTKFMDCPEKFIADYLANLSLRPSVN